MIDLNEFNFERKLKVNHKNPTKTFIGGLVIGTIVAGSVGFFLGYNFNLLWN